MNSKIKTVSFNDKTSWTLTIQDSKIKGWYCSRGCKHALLIKKQVHECRKYASFNSIQSGMPRVCKDCYEEHINEYLIKHEL